MKLRELTEKVDKSRKNQGNVDIEELATELGISYYGNYYDDTAEGARLKNYYIGHWYCTDSYVGYRAYFLDDVLVATSYQGGRKSDEEYSWVSKEAALSVKQFIESLNTSELNIDLVDLDTEYGEGFSILYGSQLLSKILIEESTGEKVTVVQTWNDRNSSTDWRNVKIERADGSIEKVALDAFLVPYNIVNE